MKRLNVLCLTALTVASIGTQAHAGRYARRAVRRTTAVVAVAAVASRPTVVAAAPVVVARPAVAPVLLPDLTVVDLAAEADVLTIVVQNIGQAPSPMAHLQANLRRPGATVLMASQTLRVLPLAVGQTMRLRLHSAPLSDVETRAVVDSANEVAELNERNNDRAIMIAAAPTPPPVLEAEVAWGQPSDQEGAAAK